MKLDVSIRGNFIDGKFPKITTGIFSPVPLKGFLQAVKQVGVAGLSFRANLKSKRDFKIGGVKQTTGTSFASVLKNTRLTDFFRKEIEKNGQPLIMDLLRVGQEKRVGNNFAAMLKKAYVKMSMGRKSSKKREGIKGHDSYAIGTGQTLMAIKGRIA
ncbi:MAG: hypothetical protein ACRCVN_05950 [Spirochaetia bacterium]